MYTSSPEHTQLIVISLLILLTVGVLYSKSFTNDIPSCDGYVSNVYIYVLLGLLITALTTVFITKRKFAITRTRSLIYLSLALIALFSLYSIQDPRQGWGTVANHLVWLAFIVALSFSLYLFWKNTNTRGIFTSTLLSTVVIFAVATSVAHLRPDWISLNWGSALTVLLITTLCVWYLAPLLGGGETSRNGKLLSAILVILITFMVLYDTKLLRAKAEVCVIPNYPKDSVGLILDFLNIFGGISKMQK